MTMSTVSPLRTNGDEQLLTGWGRTCPSMARVREPRDTADIEQAIADVGPRGLLARGLGRSYGDAAQSGGATVLDMTGVSALDLDANAGTLTAGAGASIDAILRRIVPAGFFVPVTPGTRMVTVGGTIAADVHGKNHHVDGTFGSHVRRLGLVGSTGERHELSPTGSKREQEDFWATVGGMGLTGVISDATVDLIPITSSLISVDTERAPDLDSVMASMIAGDDRYRYSVAWIDSVHPSGRGVITRGDHADLSQLPLDQRSSALTYRAKVVGTAPPFIPGRLLNKFTVRAFNEAWYRKAPQRRTDELQPIAEFFHPLDFVQEWNRVYGSGGFVQYQFVVPDSASEVVGAALRTLQRVGAPSFLTVLKRFGAANPGPLSFPQPGWTLAADVPARVPGLGRALDQLDELVASAGGRLYLAKDSRQSPDMLARTYPRLAEWQAIRDRMDPTGLFTSDLARRLSL